jgi:hypothetical protein
MVMCTGPHGSTVQLDLQSSHQPSQGKPSSSTTQQQLLQHQRQLPQQQQQQYEQY